MSLKLTAIDHVPSLKDLAYKQIQTMIINRVYKPGQHLTETEIANQLQISRGPVREAIQVLNNDGWVEVRPRQGAFVKSPNWEEIEHHFTAKLLVECETVALAAKHITPERLEYLESIIDKAENAINRGDLQGIYEYNNIFHRALSAACANPVLEGVVERLENQMKLYYALMSGVRHRESWEEHRELLAAIKRGDSDRARTLMQEHLLRTRDAYELRSKELNLL